MTALTILATAQAAHRAHVVVVPVREDGSKAPDLPSWKRFQTERPTSAQMQEWFDGERPRTGIGVICGPGGLQGIDYDDPEFFRQYRAACVAAGLGPLIEPVERGYGEDTPNGHHALFYCNAIGGNIKLAQRPKRPEEMKDEHDRVKTIIETRELGGYFVVAPSNGGVHESGEPYVLTSGAIDSIKTISPEEREALRAVARTFDQMPWTERQQPAQPGGPSNGQRPGDAFNARAEWSALLEPKGWVFVYARGDEQYWRRPGKRIGISATTNYKGSGLFYCFSTSAAPFENDTSHSKFSVYTLLHHDGDYAAAAKALAAKGYGTDQGNDRAVVPAVDVDRAATSEISEGAARAPENIAAPLASSGNIGNESEEPWDPPLSLDNPILPPFPIETLPAALREMVIEESIATQTPPGLASMIGLSVLATAVQKRAIVQVRPGYSQPLNIYTAVLMASGTRKFQVISDLTAPISERQRELGDSMQAEIAEAQTEFDVLKGRLDHAKHVAAKEKDPNEAEMALRDSQQLARDLAAMEVPHSPRLLVEDVTPEKLGALMADQGGRMAVLSAEGTLFSIIAGRYSKNGTPQLELFLKAHDGEDIYIDRIGRPSVRLEARALTLGLAVQPDVIISLGEIRAMRERGLIPRFLYWRPPNLLGRRRTNPPPVSGRTRGGFHRLIKALLDLPAGTDADGRPVPHVLTLSPEALTQWLAFVSEMEPDLAEQGDLGTIADWASKCQGTTNRIAALLHLADHGDARAPWETPISGAVMDRAITIARDCIPHAYAVLTDMGLDESLHDARGLVRVLEGWNRTQFAKRDLYQKTKGRLKTIARLDRALAVLEEHGYVRLSDVSGTPKRGRPASPIYFLNPQIHSHNSQKSDENQLEGISGNYGNDSVEVESEEAGDMKVTTF